MTRYFGSRGAPVAWVLCALAVGVIGLSGCQRAASPSPSVPREGAVLARATSGGSESDAAVYDFGRVIAGKVLTHTFRIRNPLNVAVQVASKEDIRVGCGCASVVPATWQLGTGEETDVKVEVDTTGRPGAFSTGGTITWKSADGQSHPVSLALRGEAVPPLVSNPPEVQFGPEEVRDGVSKTVVLTANVPMDWNTLSVTATQGQATITNLRSEGDKTRFEVRCAVPPGLETVGDSVTVRATVAESSPVLAGKKVDILVSVSATQQVDLQVRPANALVTFRGEEKTGTARLLLRGKALAAGAKAIRSVRCPGFTVTWALKTAEGGEGGILELVFESTDAREPAAAELVIEVGDRPAVHVPFTVVRRKT